MVQLSFWVKIIVAIVCSNSKVTKVNSKISLMKSSENDFIFSPAFYLIMCPMKAQKIFLKIFIFKTVELVSFWCVKTHFGKLPMKWCIFRHNKIWLYVVSLNQVRFRQTNHLKMTVWTREDKTIESAVPFPAPEKGDYRGLPPFHPRMIIVIGECPLLSPVWKSSPLPWKPLKCLENLPLSPSPVTGAGTGKGTPSFNVPFSPL